MRMQVVRGCWNGPGWTSCAGERRCARRGLRQPLAEAETCRLTWREREDGKEDRVSQGMPLAIGRNEYRSVWTYMAADGRRLVVRGKEMPRPARDTTLK